MGLGLEVGNSYDPKGRNDCELYHLNTLSTRSDRDKYEENGRIFCDWFRKNTSLDFQGGFLARLCEVMVVKMLISPTFWRGFFTGLFEK